MRSSLSVVVLLIVCGAGAPAGAQPKLVNPRRVFPAGDVQRKKPGQYALWAMRLSPDGGRLLYPRPKGQVPRTAEGTPDWSRARFELVLRRLDTGKETVLPVGTLDSGWRTVFTRFNPFDPAGKRLVLAKIRVERRDVGAGATAVRPTMRLVLFDIAAGRLTDTGVEEPMAMGRFDRTGRSLLIVKGSRAGLELHAAAVATGTLQPRPLGARGYVSSVCPAADVVCVWSPPQRIKPARAGERPQRGPQRLVLFDLTAKRELADLPVHQRNSKLDDWETQWTPDGRYLYYYDVIEDPAGGAPGGRRKTKPVTRIWGRVAAKPAGSLSDVVAVGPGPTPSAMVLARLSGPTRGGFLLHDAQSGAESALGGTDMHLIHAQGRRVVYAKRSADGKETPYVADIAVPGPGGKGP